MANTILHYYMQNKTQWLSCMQGFMHKYRIKYHVRWCYYTNLFRTNTSYMSTINKFNRIVRAHNTTHKTRQKELNWHSFRKILRKLKFWKLCTPREIRYIVKLFTYYISSFSLILLCCSTMGKKKKQTTKWRSLKIISKFQSFFSSLYSSFLYYNIFFPVRLFVV